MAEPTLASLTFAGNLPTAASASEAAKRFVQRQGEPLDPAEQRIINQSITAASGGKAAASSATSSGVVKTPSLPGEKSQSTTPTVFDIVNNYDWTYSENKKRFQSINQEGIPYIELSEMRIKSSTILSKLRSLVSSAPDAARAIEGTAKEIINAVANAIGAEGISGSSFTSDLLTKITAGTEKYGVGYIPNQNAGSEYLKPYTQLYITESTNISYKFPYFSNNFLAVNNSFSDTYQGFGKAVQGAIDSMAEGMADLALAVPSLIQPGVYIERPQYYNFAQEPDSIEVKFPLLNTLHAGSYVQNLEFINRFMLMNKPHRISKVLVDPPAIYSVNQPGVAYYPYAYIKRMTVEHIGTKRLVGENLVPDAFLVTLTIQPLTKEANNYMLVGHGKNNYIGADSDSAGKIQLYVVQTSGPAAKPQGSTGGSTQPTINADNVESFQALEKERKETRPKEVSTTSYIPNKDVPLPDINGRLPMGMKPDLFDSLKPKQK